MRRHGQHIVSRHVVLQSVVQPNDGIYRGGTAAVFFFFSFSLHLSLMTIDADVTAISQL